MKNWKSPKIIIGPKAMEEFYYNRPEIESLIIEEIQKGSHINIAAPRRVGKTSVVYFISKNGINGYHCIFESIQSLQSESDFYKRFYELILHSLNTNTQSKKKLNNYFSKIGIKKISLDGIEFTDKKELDYLKEIEKICLKLKKEKLKVVLFIDELPDVLYFLSKNDKKNEAISLLKNLRVWRQNNQFSNLTLVLTGSVGFHHIVTSIEGRATDLNDLNVIKFKPFTKEQAKEYIQQVTKTATIKYHNNLDDYVIEKVSYLIPYFINLLLFEVDNVARKNKNNFITKNHIDVAFNVIVKENKKFKDWKDRLFEYFPKNEALFMNEILIYTAHYDNINLRRLYDLATKHQQEIQYMDFIEILENDGYIVENNQNYTFISPFLKSFWKKKHPIYDETK